MHKRTLSFFLALVMCFSLTACGNPAVEESSTQTAENSAVESFAGTYSGIGLYADGHYLTDEYFNSWVTTLNADGSGSIAWDETAGEISAWSIQDGKLRIQAGASEMTGTLADGVMLLELDETYVVAFVAEGFDLSKLSTASMDEYMRYTANETYEGTYIPFAIGQDGVCIAAEESDDGAMTLNADGTAVCITGDVENRFTYAVEGNAITFTDDLGSSMCGTIENGILILSMPVVQSDGTTKDMQGYYALPGADTSGISVMTREEYQAMTEPADAKVTELETRYASLTDDTLRWSYDEAAKTLTVSGEGAMKSYSGSEPDWYSYSESAEHIVIADGVTSVGAGAFWYFTAAVDVSLGASVEYIGDYAFSNCYCLRSVNFPVSLKYVGVWGFGNALLHSNSGFILPEGMLYLGDGAFYSAFKESFLYIPASLTYMAEDAFDNCFLAEFQVSPGNPAYTAENGILYNKSMTTLINYPAGKTDSSYVIPGTVTTILDEAIEVSNTLETIVIPASVTNIEEGAIFWNYALNTIVVDENNSCYKSVDGVLYTKDGKTLLCYPIANQRTEYAVLEGCERIGVAAMSQANALAVIRFPDGLKEIGRLALYSTRGFTQLALPESLTVIEELAFQCCDGLQEIHYAGSSEAWQAIEIGEQNEPVTSESVAMLYGK